MNETKVRINFISKEQLLDRVREIDLADVFGLEDAEISIPESRLDTDDEDQEPGH